MSELRRADAALTEQDKTDIRRDLGLGTAATANVPASGNAASGEVVKGNDTRLSDPRTPTTHSHTAAQVTDFAAAADARIAAASVNALADIDVTSPSVGQVLKWNGAAWVNDTDDTASGGGATNLSYTPSPTGGTVHSDTGADATVPLSDGTNAGLLAPAQHAKLAGVAANATANSSDATLLARANHTGTQAASTISDFSAAADARISAAVGVTVASAAQGTDAREWTAATVDQAEAEAGAATTRRAWTAQRVAQAIAAQVAAWWAALTVGPSKITMSTARLLGRTTAGSGAAEEISVGSGLSLTAGTLSATGGGGGYEVATFADLPPAASAQTGRVYTVLAPVCVGGVPGTMWKTTGAFWMPAQRQAVFVLRTPISGPTGGVAGYLTYGAVQFQAGTLRNIARLTCSGLFTFSATDTNIRGMRVSMGQYGDNNDPTLAQNNTTVGANRRMQFNSCNRYVSDTEYGFLLNGGSGWGVYGDLPGLALSTGTQTNITVPNLSSNSVYIAPGLTQGASPSSTVTLEDFVITIE